MDTDKIKGKINNFVKEKEIMVNITFLKKKDIFINGTEAYLKSLNDNEIRILYSLYNKYINNLVENKKPIETLKVFINTLLGSEDYAYAKESDIFPIFNDYEATVRNILILYDKFVNNLYSSIYDDPNNTNEDISELISIKCNNDISTFVRNNKNIIFGYDYKKSSDVENISEEQNKLKSKDIEKIEYYLDIAESVLNKSTCIRRNYGAIIVKDDEIISTGYNGAPRGAKHCNTCKRKELKIESGTRYEMCRSVHAEANCIISAPRNRMIGATLYLSGKEYDNGNYVHDITCCDMCKRLIINAGIKNVIYKLHDGILTNCKPIFKIVDVSEWIKEI